MKKCTRCRNRKFGTLNDLEGKCKYDLPQYSAEGDVECEQFDSLYIEYPLTIEGIDNEFNIKNYLGLYRCGKLVRISPRGDEYKGKTYLGILLGDMPIGVFISFNRENKRLLVTPHSNPGIFVPELKKIIYGYESWWGEIESPEDLKDITTEEINNQWYVQLLKEITKTEECNK